MAASRPTFHDQQTARLCTWLQPDLLQVPPVEVAQNIRSLSTQTHSQGIIPTTVDDAVESALAYFIGSESLSLEDTEPLQGAAIARISVDVLQHRCTE